MIKTPQELANRIQGTLRLASKGEPSRDVLAKELKQIADELEEGSKTGSKDPRRPKSLDKFERDAECLVKDIKTLLLQISNIGDAGEATADEAQEVFELLDKAQVAIADALHVVRTI